MPRRKNLSRAVSPEQLMTDTNFWVTTAGVKRVSIQIVDAANPASRQELRDRIGKLVDGAVRTYGAENADTPSDPDARAKYREEIKAFYFALTGHGMDETECDDITNR